MVRATASVVAAAMTGASLTGCVAAPKDQAGQLTAHGETVALTLVVTDMAGLVPAEARDEPNRVLAARLQGALRRPVPDVVREASGLPVLDSLPSPRTEAIVVMNLFEPRIVGADSIEVSAEWLVFDGTGDASSWWGRDWRYLLSCDSTCTQIARHGPGYLN